MIFPGILVSDLMFENRFFYVDNYFSDIRKC